MNRAEKFKSILLQFFTWADEQGVQFEERHRDYALAATPDALFVAAERYLPQLNEPADTLAMSALIPGCYIPPHKLHEPAFNRKVMETLDYLRWLLSAP